MEFVPVLGMHRSGTSAVAGILRILGAELGTDADLLGPSGGDNPKGHFEHLAALSIDIRVLGHLGMDWRSLGSFPESWYDDEVLAGVREEIRVLLDELDGRSGGDAPVVVKEPRLCLTLPLWQTVEPLAAAVIVLRHPDAVAASLSRRNGCTDDESGLLWLAYTSGAFAHTAGVPRAIVRYEELLQAQERTARRLAAALGLPVPGDDVLRGIEEFLDPALRHHGTVAHASDAVFLRMARQVYDLLDARPRAAEELLGALAPVRQQGDRGVLGVLCATQHENAVLREELGELQIERDRLTGEVQAGEEALAASADALAELEHRLEVLLGRRSVRLALRGARIVRSLVSR